MKALATRFDTTVPQLRRNVRRESIKVEQWGKVRRLEGGDTMVAAALFKVQSDSRDATYVRYETLVDKYARQAKRTPVFEKETFFGRLQHILVVRMPAVPSLGLVEPSTIFFAAILPCVIDGYNSLDMEYMEKLGTTLDIVDIVCVQCVVGCVYVDTPRGPRWAIIDRSGDMARASFDDAEI
ncbi:hypothetical protein BJ138DRAFT_1124709 [Hygrophoropsis aurantiaca]|uniref:Uncharacterized protein n=1 Tax=Hygrophoropsis aurantiaca TaxID=72124 RepID=A0ACB8AIJ2_9AGAM|nr:hypothetical protein BJ138DRAFT_1124709 [Hygrophoropsis aurantiaca]